MSSKYTDGVQTIIMKSKYAYHYNKAGSLIGKSQFEQTVEDKNFFIEKLFAAGFHKEEKLI